MNSLQELLDQAPPRIQEVARKLLDNNPGDNTPFLMTTVELRAKVARLDRESGRIINAWSTAIALKENIIEGGGPLESKSPGVKPLTLEDVNAYIDRIRSSCDDICARLDGIDAMNEKALGDCNALLGREEE